MPRQSTRVKYKTRRERDKALFRKIRLVLWFSIPILLIIILRNWRDHWAWLKTFFMD